MTEREMFEKAFERPRNYFDLPGADQCAIDKRLGILDWEGRNLTKEDLERFHKYYN